MAIKSIEIKNILSFEHIKIDNIRDLNCIIGRNNVGKSNLFKTLRFFYNKLEGKNGLPPNLYSNYSYKGSISLVFDTTRIFRIARKNKTNSYFSFLMRKLIPEHQRTFFELKRFSDTQTKFTLTLFIYNDNSTKWSINDKQTRNLILYLYPFFYIEPRHMNLYDWDDLWDLIARIKSFNLSKIDNDDVINFFDNAINVSGSHSYRDYIADLNSTLSTKKGSQKEKILSYIRAGLNGYKFEINDRDLQLQSDGTNSFHFIKIFLKILITISKREYISPFVLVDEPEIGLHPKMNDILINEIWDYYKYKDDVENKTIQPRIFLITHSPNIVKEIVKKFKNRHNIFCFQKSYNSPTKVNKLNSHYDSDSFINIFSDNEARLFFSTFILFVEGETELELFGNMKLCKYFPQLTSIDIYKCSSNVIGERINPSYSNAAIPYLFLFDADKAWGLDSQKNSLKIKTKKNGLYFDLKKDSLLKAKRKYSLGYNSKHFAIKKNISYILENTDKEIKISKFKQSFKEDVDFEEIHYAINKYLLLKNCYITRSTIEGCLISIHSAPIFWEWLDNKYKLNSNSILSKLTKNNLTLSLNNLIEYIKVIFNGKTSILNKSRQLKDVSQNSTTCEKSKKTICYIEEIFSKYNVDTDKTSGWVTSFINFSICYIENTMNKEQTFDSEFKVYFPELYGIIQKLQPDSLKGV